MREQGTCESEQQREGVRGKKKKKDRASEPVGGVCIGTGGGKKGAGLRKYSETQWLETYQV